MKRIGARLRHASWALLAVAAGAHAAISPELQKAMRAATFEVVHKKAEHDAVVYEKALPLDLLPFGERTDAYESIGSAFALGHNTYVTAAHVLVPCVDSQLGPPMLRASSSKVFPIARILKFSLDQDFAVFALADDSDPPAFDTNRSPQLDDPVFAVGNALGEGIVIRDGLFTSETPEEQDGRWKWIRFSAAASPGNSGGPLLDANGRVIGIVIRKSPNENLNYSLPIGRVLDAPAGKATFDQRTLTHLPFLHGNRTYRFTDEFKLPLTWPEFGKAYRGVVAKHAERARRELLAANDETFFPKGPGSDVLLANTQMDYLPRLIAQDASDKWVYTQPAFESADLPADGFVQVGQIDGGGALFRLHRSSDASDDGFYSDSKALMDLLLKALPLARQVGPDRIKVVSLGAAQDNTLVTDRHGRKWQQRVWAVPYLDAYVLSLALPTPDGYLGVVGYAPSSLLEETLANYTLLLEQMDVSYWGTLAQWKAFLHRRVQLPAALSEFRLEQAGVWRVLSPLFQVSMPATVLPIDEQSGLGLGMSFIAKGARLDWQPTAIWWYRDNRRTAYAGLWRAPRPPASAKLEERNKFTSMHERRSPYDSHASRETSDGLRIETVIDVPGSKSGLVASDVVYGLTIGLDGYLSTTAMLDRQEALQRAVTILDRGSSEERAVAPAASTEAVPAGALDTYIQEADKVSAAYGADLRGKTMSDDMRTFVMPVASNETKLREQLTLVSGYWNSIQQLEAEKDFWRRFATKNRVPADVARYPKLVEAQERTRRTLTSEPLNEHWADEVHLLIGAYQEQRHSMFASLSTATPGPIAYRQRTAACPAPATATSGRRRAHSARFPVPRPTYPAISRREGEEGAVVLSLEVDAQGCVQRAGVQVSSGSDYLDVAALDWIETAEFLPGEVDGKAVASVMAFSVNFKLTDD